MLLRHEELLRMKEKREDFNEEKQTIKNTGQGRQKWRSMVHLTF